MPNFEHSYALIIGINDYGNGISSLKTAVSDAIEIARILETEHDYTVTLLLNQAATLSQLRQVLEIELPKQIQAGDRFLFYFAGHGIALNGEDGPEGYLVPENAKFGNVSTYLPMSDVNQALLQLPCRHFLGILDCCFAGAFRWSSLRKAIAVELGILHKERYDRFIQDPAWQVLTSAASDQSAWDAFDLKDDRGQIGVHSPFACALIEALQGKADAFPPAETGKPAGDGVITATELYLYLRDRVEIATETRAIRQTPGIHCLKKHDKGEYIFLTPGHALNLPPAPPLDVSKNPYRGLQPFEEKHSKLFFGRTELIEKLQNFVKTHPLTVVLGASGSGKSSLVKAGLIPQLRKEKTEKWYFLPPIRPGKTPLPALNHALKKINLPEVDPQNPQHNLGMSIDVWAKKFPNYKLLLFIDQSEEIITLCQNESERKEFFQEILTAINTHRDKLRVVLSLRSDFEPQVRDAGLKFFPTVLKKEVGNTDTELKKRWSNGRFIVPGMTRAELRQAIEKPAEARVMYFNPHDLVEQLINEVADMPGALSLLSFALSELYLKYLKRQWDAENGGITIDRALTQEDYQALGGVTLSLTQRADEEYQALVQKNPAYSQVIRHVMLRMVALGGGELARRQVLLSELEYPPDKNSLVKEVIERFSTARLLIEGQDAEGNPYVEPAHDALVRGWEKLLMWKQEEEESLLLQRRLTPAAEEWKIQQQPRFLWNGNPRLDLLKKELNSQDNWLNKLEAEFVERSVKRKTFNTRLYWGIALGVILGLSGLTIWALWNSQISKLQAKAANVKNQTSVKPVDALLQAIESNNQFLHESVFEVRSSLLSAVETPKEKTKLYMGSSEPRVAFLNNRRIVSLNQRENTISIWENKVNQIWEKTDHSIPIKERQVDAWKACSDAIVFSASNENGNNSSVYLWHLQQARSQPQVIQKDITARFLAISADCQTIAVGNYNEVRLFDKQGKKLSPPFTSQNQNIAAVAISPKKDYIAIADGPQIVLRKIEDNQNISPVRNLKPKSESQKLKTTAPKSPSPDRPSENSIKFTHPGGVNAITFSPNGQFVVSAGNDRTLRLWNLSGKSVVDAFKGHEDVVTSVAFSPNGKFIVSGSRDNSLRLWDLYGNQIGEPLQGHESWVMAVAVSPDSDSILSSSNDRTIRLWDKNEEKLTLLFSPKDGERRVVYSEDKVVFSIDGKGKNTRDIEDITDDGQTSVKVGADRQSILWERGKQKVTVSDSVLERSNEETITAIALAPDGKSVVSGTNRGTIQLWNIQDNQSFQKANIKLDCTNKEEQCKNIMAISLSQDGKFIASGSLDNIVRLWNSKGEFIHEFKGHTLPIESIAFSHDGKSIASGSQDNTVRLWNTKELENRQLLRGHKGWVSAIAFSPDDKFIATGSWDKTVRLWDRDGNPMASPFKGHTQWISSVRFSSDGKSIISGSAYDAVRWWQAGNPEDWLKKACSQLRNHPVFQKPQNSLEEGAKKTCQKYN